MCDLGILFGHKLSQLKLEIHVVKYLSQRQRRLQTRCQNINFEYQVQMRWLLKEMEDGSVIGFIACYAQNTTTGD